jgi:hypothetical protein
MTDDTLFTRIGGAAILLGGLIAAVALIFHPDDIAAPRSAPTHLALYVAVLLLLFGLPGLGRILAQRSRVLAAVGTVLLFFGLAFEDPLHSVLAFTVIPVLAADPNTRSLINGPPPPILEVLQFGSAVPILAGLILLAVAVWRTAVLPRWTIGALLIAIVGLALAVALPPSGPIGPILLYLSLATLGWPLLRPTTH